MRAILLTGLLAFFGNAVVQAAPPPAAPAKVRTIRVPVNPRTIQSLPNFPLAHLKTSLNAKLYKSLSISELTAWVAVQVPPFGADPKIVHSEAGGAYDKLALQMAKGWGGVGFNTTESRTHAPSLMVHLLVFKIADGIMVVNFSHNDEAFHAGLQHTDVYVGILKDGKWTRVGGTKVQRQSTEMYR